MRGISKLRVLIVVISLLAAASAEAEERTTTSTTSKSLAEAQRRMADLESTLRESQAKTRELVQALGALQQESLSPVIAKYQEAKIAAYDHSIKLMGHIRRAFAWQQFASYTILFIVILVAVAGIAFSGLQLRHSMRMGQVRENVELTVESGKIQVRSSVIGIAVLVLSLGFLYLFLDRVYEMKPIDLAPEPSSPAATR